MIGFKLKIAFYLFCYILIQTQVTQAFNANKPSPFVVIFIGDSLTEGYGLTKSVSYPLLLESKLKMEGYNVKIINAGISGATSQGALSQVKWYAKLKPHSIFLALGANDGLRGHSVVAMVNNLQSAIDYAKTQKIPISLIGMRMPPNYGNKYTTEFEGAFLMLAKKNQLDLYPFLLDQVATHPELNLADGIHPNEKGHQVMATQIYSFVKKTLIKQGIKREHKP